MNAILLFGEELKKNRQAKQISLTQVSAATRINERFLEAIEAGSFSVLPEPYIRAFLREYAVATELNPDDTLRKYHDAVQASKPAPAPVAQPQREVRTPSHLLNEQQQARLVSLARRAGAPTAVVAAVLVVILFLSSSGSTDPQANAPAEVSFDRVVKESEAALVKNQPESNRPERTAARATTDSLHLEMTTVDSLWIVVVIDDKRTEEYLFPPKYHRRWVAKEQFSVTMGNATSATFRLNGKELGSLGKPGAVVRNAIITEETATKL